MKEGLAAELISLAEEERNVAAGLFARCEREPDLDAELERRLGGPVRPLLLGLAEWGPGAPAEGRRRLEVNRRNTMRLRELVGEHGWPGRSLVGEDAADAAWLLLQHADLDNEFRRSTIALVEVACANGDADPRHVAYLVDRTASVAGEPQVYGTIVELDGVEPRFLLPLAGDPDAARRAIGMPSVAEDAAYLAGGDELIPYREERGAGNRWP